jgi:hypothetical protein
MQTEIQGTPLKYQKHCRAFGGWCCAGLLLVVAAMPAEAGAQVHKRSETRAAQPSPQPAMAAILSAFDKYEVVGMEEGHGMKDEDDFILSLIRDPAFADKVNDIVVECGNSLYQPMLDRYIAGEDVPFAEARKVWRNTTQPMCGMSGFFEEFFPLVRAINLSLPREKRLRVLAGDPPIDWSQVKNSADIAKFSDRDASIAAVMEKEVLAKHRRALMLFGIFHLMHGGGVGAGNAVTIYEKEFPGRTFVIADLGTYTADASGTAEPSGAASPFAVWPIASVVRSKGTWLGDLDLAHFFPPTVWTDEDCNVHNEFPKGEQKPMAELVDAFLYLGPEELRLTEPVPADIALDAEYMTELHGREMLMGLPGSATWTLKASGQQIVDGAGSPVLAMPKREDPTPYFPFIRKACMERKSNSSS